MLTSITITDTMRIGKYTELPSQANFSESGLFAFSESRILKLISFSNSYLLNNFMKTTIPIFYCNNLDSMKVLLLILAICLSFQSLSQHYITASRKQVKRSMEKYLDKHGYQGSVLETDSTLTLVVSDTSV